ncbi:MAG: 50S ribosomal protein L10 [Cryomorphaceae bacterium]|nr:MAG: 50S ribosomal protein L10 [Cryomorphaceae bacterium]
MTKEQKQQLIEELSASIAESGVLYVADTSTLTVETTNALRRKCFNAGIKLRVVKNTLLQKALERVEGRDFSELNQVLTGPTAVMFSEVGNAPAKLIKEFRKKFDRPVLKGAWIEETVYIGDDQLENLVNIKSRDELIADVVALLQSPAKNVVSALQSGKTTIAGLVKALEERAA